MLQISYINCYNSKLLYEISIVSTVTKILFALVAQIERELISLKTRKSDIIMPVYAIYRDTIS